MAPGQGAEQLSPRPGRSPQAAIARANLGFVDIQMTGIVCPPERVIHGAGHVVVAGAHAGRAGVGPVLALAVERVAGVRREEDGAVRAAVRDDVLVRALVEYGPQVLGGRVSHVDQLGLQDGRSVIDRDVEVVRAVAGIPVHMYWDAGNSAHNLDVAVYDGTTILKSKLVDMAHASTKDLGAVFNESANEDVVTYCGTDSSVFFAAYTGNTFDSQSQDGTNTCSSGVGAGYDYVTGAMYDTFRGTDNPSHLNIDET